jgi:hypothetical protein
VADRRPGKITASRPRKGTSVKYLLIALVLLAIILFVLPRLRGGRRF